MITSEMHRKMQCLQPALVNRVGLILLHAAAAKSLQSCPTLCDPIDSSPPGSPIPGILQARTLEWVAISSSLFYIDTWSVTPCTTREAS